MRKRIRASCRQGWRPPIASAARRRTASTRRPRRAMRRLRACAAARCRRQGHRSATASGAPLHATMRSPPSARQTWVTACTRARAGTRAGVRQRGCIVEPARRLMQRALHRVERVRRTGERGRSSSSVAQRGVSCVAGPRVRRRDQFGHRHPVLGQRAGLVGAQHRDRAQRLDRRRAPHQRLVPRHAPRAQREEHRQHDRKFFRMRRDRQRDAGQQRLQPAAARRRIQPATSTHAANAERRRTTARRAAISRCSGVGFDARCVRSADADLSDGGARAGRDDFRGAVAAHDQRAGMQQPCPRYPLRRPLRDRHRFAGQQRFVDMQVGRLDHARIRRHAIALDDQRSRRRPPPRGPASCTTSPSRTTRARGLPSSRSACSACSDFCSW